MKAERETRMRISRVPWMVLLGAAGVGLLVWYRRCCFRTHKERKLTVLAIERMEDEGGPPN